MIVLSWNERQEDIFCTPNTLVPKLLNSFTHDPGFTEGIFVRNIHHTLVADPAFEKGSMDGRILQKGKKFVK